MSQLQGLQGFFDVVYDVEAHNFVKFVKEIRGKEHPEQKGFFAQEYPVKSVVPVRGVVRFWVRYSNEPRH